MEFRIFCQKTDQYTEPEDIKIKTYNEQKLLRVWKEQLPSQHPVRYAKVFYCLIK